MEQWEFIERVAQQLGIKPDAFRKWRIGGVPAKHRLEIVDAAGKEGFAFDRSAFDQPPGPRQRTSHLAGGDVTCEADS